MHARLLAPCYYTRGEDEKPALTKVEFRVPALLSPHWARCHPWLLHAFSFGTRPPIACLVLAGKAALTETTTLTADIPFCARAHGFAVWFPLHAMPRPAGSQGFLLSLSGRWRHVVSRDSSKRTGTGGLQFHSEIHPFPPPKLAAEAIPLMLSPLPNFWVLGQRYVSERASELPLCGCSMGYIHGAPSTPPNSGPEGCTRLISSFLSNYGSSWLAEVLRSLTGGVTSCPPRCGNAPVPISGHCSSLALKRNN